MKNPKISPKSHSCEVCDYITSNLKDYNKHLLTSKHTNRTKLNDLEQKNPQNPQNFFCKYCNKSYRARNSLWYHEQKCIGQNESIIIPQKQSNIKEEPSDKDLIMMLINQNKELLELVKNGITNNSHNTTTNSHNKAFNLNFFLNETCKNAMNITDFVDSIKLQLSDLMNIGELGFVEGISKIIVKNLNELDETVRPVHCTDKKRETMYIKDQGEWQKDDDKSKLRKTVKNIADKNIKLLPQFREKFPDYKDSRSKTSDIYDKMVVEVMTTDENKEEKIMKNISKATTISNTVL